MLRKVRFLSHISFCSTRLARMRYCCNSIILSHDLISCKCTTHNDDDLPSEREREAAYLILMMSLTRDQPLASWSREDNGKDGIFLLSPITTEPRSVPDELMCKHGGLNRLLTLQGLCWTPAPSDSAFSSLFVFHSEGNECINANAKYCGECIQAGAKCGWCKDPVCESKLSAIITAIMMLLVI